MPSRCAARLCLVNFVFFFILQNPNIGNIFIRIPFLSFSSKKSLSAYFMSPRKLGLVKVSVKSLSPEKLQRSIRLWHLGCHSALLYPSSEKCQELFSSEVETHRATRHTHKTHPPMYGQKRCFNATTSTQKQSLAYIKTN